MITLLIDENEKKIKKLISEILSREGYQGDEILGQGDILKIVNNEKGGSLDFLREKIKKLEESFIKENKGKLYRTVLDAMEKTLLERVLEYSEGNQLKTARILGINRNTVRSKIKKHKVMQE